MGIVTQPNLLVIGGSGFIGGAIVKHAIELGWQVDSLGMSIPNEDRKIQDVTYIAGDITDSETMKFLEIKKYDYIVNSGGYINHSVFSSGGDEVLEAHFGGVVNLVKSINRTNLKRFINIGSSDEYGNTPAPQSELNRERPISPYSAGKAAATQFLQMLYLTERFPAVTLRLFLCYGPGQDRMRFLPHLISRCIANEQIEISPGEQVRDYCFIDDIVEAVFLSMANDDVNGKVFNIASGNPISIKQVVEKVTHIIGSGNPKFGAVPYRDGESMELYADVNLAKKVLSWSAKTSLSDGLTKTIAHYAE
jgi:nucleoside-diphosphate-sugar epimerase